MADFKRIKEEVSIENVLKMLNLQMKRSGAQLRSECPACRNGGPRALAVTVDRGSYYCFSDKKGGDCIALVSHVLGISARDAGEKIAQYFNIDSSPTAPSPKPEAAMKPLDDLDPTAAEVESLGITPTAADALGIGYRTRGTLGAGVYIPLRSEEGTLVGYMRVNLEDENPFRFPTNLEDRATGNVVKLERRKA